MDLRFFSGWGNMCCYVDRVFQPKFGNTMMKIWDIKMIVMDLTFARAHDASEKGLVSAHNSS